MALLFSLPIIGGAFQIVASAIKRSYGTKWLKSQAFSNDETFLWDDEPRKQQILFLFICTRAIVDMGAFEMHLITDNWFSLLQITF